MRSILLLAVVSILSRAPSSLNVSAIQRAASAAVELRTDLKLLSEEDLFVLANPQRRVLDCGSDLRCVSERLRALDADLGLIVVVSDVDDGVLIDLRLIETDDGRLIASDASTYTPSEGPLLDAISARIARVLEDAGHRRGGRLRVIASPAGARVFVDGQELERELVLPAGEHVVRASLDGHEDAEQRVSIAEGATETVSIELTPERSIVEAWWLWTAIGIAVLGATAAIAVVATRPDPIFCASTTEDPSCD